jgi:hypothetical protein
MLSDGLSKRAAIMELSYAFESNRRLLEAGREQAQKEAELEALKGASQVTDQHVLNELVDCGVRADSLYLLTLMPLVHVAWSNGYVTRDERVAVLKAAERDGIRNDSPGFKVLEGWLTKKPDASVFRTWKDYVAAIRMFLSPESFAALHCTTLGRAWNVADAAGGLLGFFKVSRAEEAAIEELNLAFLQ